MAKYFVKSRAKVDEKDVFRREGYDSESGATGKIGGLVSVNGNPVTALYPKDAKPGDPIENWTPKAFIESILEKLPENSDQ